METSQESPRIPTNLKELYAAAAAVVKNTAVFKQGLDALMTQVTSLKNIGNAPVFIVKYNADGEILSIQSIGSNKDPMYSQSVRENMVKAHGVELYILKSETPKSQAPSSEVTATTTTTSNEVNEALPKPPSDPSAPQS